MGPLLRIGPETTSASVLETTETTSVSVLERGLGSLVAYLAKMEADVVSVVINGNEKTCILSVRV